MKIKFETKRYALPSQGRHAATCIGVIDYGTQKSNFQGSKKTSSRMLVIRWEIDGELTEDGHRHTVQRPYTSSLNEKSTLRKHLEAWRGTPFSNAELTLHDFDMKEQLGKPCMITIAHSTSSNGFNRADVTTIMPLPKATPTPALPLSPLVYISLAKGEFDEAAFLKLPSATQVKIKASPEYQALVAGPMPSNLVAFSKSTTKEPWDSDDDVPFE